MVNAHQSPKYPSYLRGNCVAESKGGRESVACRLVPYELLN